MISIVDEMKRTAKLNGLLDKWFDQCGMTAKAQVTETDFVDCEFNEFEYAISHSDAVWNSMPIRQKVASYYDMGFKDHVHFSEREFLLSL